MLIRSLIVWFGLLLLAIANGGVREGLLMRRMGPAPAHALSSVTLSIAIVVLVWFSIGWMAPARVGDAWRIGALWLGLTLAFEFLAGHYLFGTPWRELLADYDVLHGRLWVLVLVSTLLSPVLIARTRLF